MAKSEIKLDFDFSKAIRALEIVSQALDEIQDSVLAARDSLQDLQEENDRPTVT